MTVTPAPAATVVARDVSLRDRLAEAMYERHPATLRDRLAEAMHERHRVASPAYDDMSPGYQRWMLEQADVAIEVFAAYQLEEEGY